METITIRDIARICGVGVSTVSRAINNHPDINPATKAMIMQVIKEHNFVPNNSARNLKRINTRTIAVLVKGISNPFFSRMFQVFEEEIQENRYSFILQQVKEREDELEAALELIKEKKLKGIIFLGGYFSHTKEELAQIGIPFVLSTIGIPKDVMSDSYSSVSVDDMKESFTMVDYLCRIGHKRIAIVSAPADDESIGRLRLEGYFKALRAHEIPVDSRLILRMKEEIETYSIENGYVVTKEFLETGVDFTALYAVSDSIAVGAAKAILESGKRIPADYSVAGFDGLDLARYYHPSITTMKQPAEAMARETIRLLFEHIKKKTPPKQILFPAELVIGESTQELSKTDNAPV